MGRIKASDIPAPLLHAFVDALEAWSDLEWELFLIWQYLTGPADSEKQWKSFSTYPTSKQRTETIKLVEDFLRKTQFAPKMPEAFSQLKELTGIRDRLVHGYWHPIHLGRSGAVEYIRKYDARGHSARPIDEEDEKRMLGISRFYRPQLLEAEQRFRETARDIRHALAVMVISQHGKR